MKIIRKALAVLMAAVLLSSVLMGCTTLKKLEDGTYDRGAVINLYLSDPVYNFDPQVPVTDDAMLKVFSLIYEGLTTLKSNGKWQKAMMDSYTVKANDLDGYSIFVTLKQTKWTDGREVQAVDFVYSWKRLLEPDFKGEAACLLYDIKNAREINTGDKSIDDLGVSAVDTYTLKITFESSDIDLDRFFTNLSAIALVPVREDIIARYGDDWAQRPTSIVTNGPFTVKQMIEDNEEVIRLERNGYYFRDIEKDYLDKYVIPYRLVTNYDVGDLEAQLAAYDGESIFYVGELPLSVRADYKKKAEVEDTLITQSFIFNTKKDPFTKAEVRRALSLALDREKIAEMLVFAVPATGLVPAKAFDTTRKTSFRKEAGDILSTSANVSEAKNLLSSAGVSSGSFSITVRDNEADIAVAEYAAEVWKELGFNVTVDVAKVGRTDPISEDEGSFVYNVDTFENKYTESNFDVILTDVSMPSPDPFSVLAPYAGDFSGYGTDLYPEVPGNYEIFTHPSGYTSDSYMDLIEKAFAEKNLKNRAPILHDAEKLLMEDMPVCPLVYLQSAYIKSKILKGFDTDYYGVTNFKRVKMKNYMKYKQEDTEE